MNHSLGEETKLFFADILQMLVADVEVCTAHFVNFMFVPNMCYLLSDEYTVKSYWTA